MKNDELIKVIRDEVEANMDEAICVCFCFNVVGVTASFWIGLHYQGTSITFSRLLKPENVRKILRMNENLYPESLRIGYTETPSAEQIAFMNGEAGCFDEV